MRYIILLLFVHVVSLSDLKLKSKQTSDLLVPLKKKHNFSCELLAFPVLNRKMNITIDHAPSQVLINLTINYKNHTDIRICSTQRGKCEMSYVFQNETYPDHEFKLQLNIKYEDKSEDREVFIIFKNQSKTNHIDLPKQAIAITQLFGLIFIVLLPLNVQYRQIKPFTYNIYTAFLYMLFLLFCLYLGQIFQSELIYQIQEYSIALFAFACFVVYFQDLMLFLIDKRVLTLIISFTLGVALVIWQYFCPGFEGAFFLSDIFAFMVAGAFIKFFIIRKLKISIRGLALMWIFFAFRQFAIQMSILQFQQGLGIRIIPLFLQLKGIMGDSPTGYPCSAFGSSKIIAFGVILNYCKRVDLYLSSHFYRMLSNTLAIICILLELIFNLLSDDLPTMQFMSVLLYYPLSVGLMLFFANKRGEWAEIWHGSFYDIAVNRASIARSVNFEEIEKNFGKNLLLNSHSDKNDQ